MVRNVRVRAHELGLEVLPDQDRLALDMATKHLNTPQAVGNPLAEAQKAFGIGWPRVNRLILIPWRNQFY